MSTMVLGVTGGIACGKSTVTELLGNLGATIVSADQLAREAVRPGSTILTALTDRFGQEILLPDGHLNRPALAELVFGDKDARTDLERIMHPAIAALAEDRLQKLRSEGHRLIVYEAPLLFEAGAEKRVDAVLVVTASQEQQIARLQIRDHLTRRQALARLNAQIPLAEKIRRADFLIDNSGAKTTTTAQVKALFARLTATVPSPAPEGN